SNIVVAVRVRPPDGHSKAGNNHVAVFPGDVNRNAIVVDRNAFRGQLGIFHRDKQQRAPSIQYCYNSPSGHTKPGSPTSCGGIFTFDHVFWSMFEGKGERGQGSIGSNPAPFSSQADVFEGIGKEVVDRCLDGFNSCLFAYGQTGSGKTFTMMGADCTAKSSSSQSPLGAVSTSPSSTFGDKNTANTASGNLLDPHLHINTSHKNLKITTSTLDTVVTQSNVTPVKVQCKSNMEGCTVASPSESFEEPLPTPILPTAPWVLPLQKSPGNNTFPKHTPSSPHGLIPRLCYYLFERVSSMGRVETCQVIEPPESWGTTTQGCMASTSNASREGPGGIISRWSIRVSFTEIYLEKVRDLLDVSDKPNANLKVREHPELGPFVSGITWKTVDNSEQMETILLEGQERRMVAGTNMNEASSRSHAIFTIEVVCTQVDPETGAKGDTVSKVVNLVDLAGSENSNSAGSTGMRLKEGASINKSLLTLGRVIKALAAAA
ncbi:unnamed protein product, partial [Choristocarpus tenellus]